LGRSQRSGALTFYLSDAQVVVVLALVVFHELLTNWKLAGMCWTIVSIAGYHAAKHRTAPADAPEDVDTELDTFPSNQV
jgi:hypothetical protein